MQDPIARAYSAWTMSKRMACRQQARKDALAVCTFPTFAQMVVDEAKMLRRRGCTFSRAVCPSCPLSARVSNVRARSCFQASARE